jgi:hypothetical protein
MKKAIVTGAALLITTVGGATAVSAAAALPAALLDMARWRHPARQSSNGGFAVSAVLG